MKKIILLFLLMAVFILTIETAKSGNVTIPNSFSTGQLIQAADMNANFTAVETAIDDNDSRISTNAGAISSKQDRVTGTCASGSSIRVINANGTVTCETDNTGSGGGGDITGVTAGSGLSGGGTSGDVTLSIASGGVTATHIATGAVGSSEIATDAITRSKIGTSAIGINELGSNAVDSSKIKNYSITNSDISSSAGISISKIQGAAGIDYRPRSSFPLNSIFLSNNSVQNMGNIVVNAPGAGVIVVQLSGYAWLNDDQTVAQVGISRSSTSFTSSRGYVRMGNASDIKYLQSIVYFPFHAMMVYPVSSSGSVAFFANAQRNSSYSQGNVQVNPGYMVGTYYPNPIY